MAIQAIHTRSKTTAAPYAAGAMTTRVRRSPMLAVDQTTEAVRTRAAMTVTPVRTALSQSRGGTGTSMVTVSGTMRVLPSTVWGMWWVRWILRVFTRAPCCVKRAAPRQGSPGRGGLWVVSARAGTRGRVGLAGGRGLPSSGLVWRRGRGFGGGLRGACGRPGRWRTHGRRTGSRLARGRCRGRGCGRSSRGRPSAAPRFLLCHDLADAGAVGVVVGAGLHGGGLGEDAVRLRRQVRL